MRTGTAPSPAFTSDCRHFIRTFQVPGRSATFHSLSNLARASRACCWAEEAESAVFEGSDGSFLASSSARTGPARRRKVARRTGTLVILPNFMVRLPLSGSRTLPGSAVRPRDSLAFLVELADQAFLPPATISPEHNELPCLGQAGGRHFALVVDGQQDPTVLKNSARLVLIAIVIKPLASQLAGLVRLGCGSDAAQQEQPSGGGRRLHQ